MRVIRRAKWVTLTPCVEPIGSQEHGEKEDDHGVGPEGNPESQRFSSPRGLAGSGDLGAVGTNHIVGVHHKEGDGDTDECEHKEPDLIMTFNMTPMAVE